MSKVTAHSNVYRRSSLLVLFIALSVVLSAAGGQSFASELCTGIGRTTANTTVSDFIQTPGQVRITEADTIFANCKEQVRSVEIPSINGGLAPITDTEEETLHASANTVQKRYRLFGRDPDSRRQLRYVIEEEETIRGQGYTVVRNVFDVDINGEPQLVQREVSETVSAGHNNHSNATLFMNTANGFAPVQKTSRSERRDPDGRVEARITVLTVDANGRFIPTEISEISMTDAAGTRITDERVFSGVSGVDLSAAYTQPTWRTVTRAWKDIRGEHRIIERYLPAIAGVTPGSGMYLAEEVSSTTTTMADGGTRTQEEVRDLNPAMPSDGLRLAERVTQLTHTPAKGQTERETTLESWDGNQGLKVVDVVSTRSSTQHK